MRRLPPLLAVAAIAGCGGGDSNTASTTTTATTAPVSIKNFDFHPVSLNVAAGTTVRWTNEDASNYTATGEHGAKIKLGNVDQGKSVHMRFTTPGTYRYYGEYHPNMHARIVVR